MILYFQSKFNSFASKVKIIFTQLLFVSLPIFFEQRPTIPFIPNILNHSQKGVIFSNVPNREKEFQSRFIGMEEKILPHRRLISLHDRLRRNACSS